MHLPSVVAAVLGVRQLANVLPASYCSPECPSCKDDIAAYDGDTTSCTPNSTFITNCGACQECVLTYNIQKGETSLSNQIEVALINILNLCSNSPASTQIEALQSQASRLSAWGENLVTTTTASATAVLTTITPTPTATATVNWAAVASDNPSWTSILSTATWASKYSSRISAASVAAQASLSSESVARYNQTAVATSTPISTNTPLSSTSNPPPSKPLSQTWVVGPVMGSVLGMSTVFIVIFFTRRKYLREARSAIQDAVPKPYHDAPSTRSSSAADNLGPEGKPQLHSEFVEAKELETTEVHELPALEPVGSELNTPMEAKARIRLGGDSIREGDEEDEWAMQSPLPLSPLPLLFAMSELRDERMGRSESLRHETYYHP